MIYVKSNQWVFFDKEISLVGISSKGGVTVPVKFTRVSDAGMVILIIGEGDARVVHTFDEKKFKVVVEALKINPDGNYSCQSLGGTAVPFSGNGIGNPERSNRSVNVTDGAKVGVIATGDRVVIDSINM